jgi:hypothetical protein
MGLAYLVTTVVEIVVLMTLVVQLVRIAKMIAASM